MPADEAELTGSADDRSLVQTPADGRSAALIDQSDLPVLDGVVNERQSQFGVMTTEERSSATQQDRNDPNSQHVDYVGCEE